MYLLVVCIADSPILSRRTDNPTELPAIVRRHAEAWPDSTVAGTVSDDHGRLVARWIERPVAPNIDPGAGHLRELERLEADIAATLSL